MELDVGKTALALLHFQKDICEADGIMAPGEAEALDRISTAKNQTKTLLAGARHAQLPILYSAFGRSRSGALANRYG
jgi:nicotinamidase-related amidase